MEITNKESLIFASGTALGLSIGAVVAWLISKNYYKKIVDEEVASVKKSFEFLQQKAQEQADIAKNKPTIDLMAQALKLQKASEANVDHSTIDNLQPADTHAVNYSNFSAEENEETEDEEEDPDDETYGMPGPIESSEEVHDGPYILNGYPSETEEPYYTAVTLIRYEDGTYADSHGVEHEVEDYIGLSLIDYVDKTDKDEIIIRNDELQLDIDIIKDARTYDEVMFG